MISIPAAKAIPAVANGFSEAKARVFAVHSLSFSRAISCFSLNASAELEAPLRTLLSAVAALLESASTASCAADVAFSVRGDSVFVSLTSGLTY